MVMLTTAGYLSAQQYGSFKDPRDGKVYKTLINGEKGLMGVNITSDTVALLISTKNENFSNDETIFFMNSLSMVKLTNGLEHFYLELKIQSIAFF